MGFFGGCESHSTYLLVSISVFPDTAGREAIVVEPDPDGARTWVVVYLLRSVCASLLSIPTSVVVCRVRAAVLLRHSGDELFTCEERPLWLRGCLSGATKRCLLCLYEGEHISIRLSNKKAVVHLSSALP